MAVAAAMFTQLLECLSLTMMGSEVQKVQWGSTALIGVNALSNDDAYHSKH